MILPSRFCTYFCRQIVANLSRIEVKRDQESRTGNQPLRLKNTKGKDMNSFLVCAFVSLWTVSFG